jgi:hypothetical protein
MAVTLLLAAGAHTIRQRVGSRNQAESE